MVDDAEGRGKGRGKLVLGGLGFTMGLALGFGPRGFATGTGNSPASNTGIVLVAVTVLGFLDCFVGFEGTMVR